MNCVKLIRLCAFLSCIMSCAYCVLGFDFGFYYNSYAHEVIFYNFKESLNAELTLDPQFNRLYPIYLTNFMQAVDEKKLLLEENLIDSYEAKAELGLFQVANHSLLLDGVPIFLVRIDYNVSSIHYNEVIMEVPSLGKFAAFPQIVESFFQFNPCTLCSKEAIARTNKEISSTFAFQLDNALLSQGEIEKVYLMAKHKDRLVYYADLSNVCTVQAKDGSVTSIDFYLERLPEVFDLHITYHVIDDSNFKGEKLLLAIKDNVNPDYEVDLNPNFKMLVICISIVASGFLLTGIGLIIKLFVIKN